MELLGEKLRTRRKEQGLTLEDVSKAIGVTRATVQRWETGSIKVIGSDKIVALARVLDMPPEELIGLEPEKSNSDYDPRRPQMTQQQEILFDVTGDLTEEEMDKVIQMVNLMKSMRG